METGWVLFLLGVHCSAASMKSLPLGGDCTGLSLTALPPPPHLHPLPASYQNCPGSSSQANVVSRGLVMSLLLVMGWFFLKGQPRSCLCKPEIMERIVLWVCTGSSVETGPSRPVWAPGKKRTQAPNITAAWMLLRRVVNAHSEEWCRTRIS